MTFELNGHVRRWNKKLKKENNMNHFIGWKFGVPIKIVNRYNSSYGEERRLIGENTCGFYAVELSSLHSNFYGKDTFSYELIPYNCGGTSNRYPVCVNKEKTAYCNFGRQMNYLTIVSSETLVRTPEKATITVEGKTIELSAENIAEIKKKLGI